MSAPTPEEAERRALEILGLARRAGRVELGTRAVREAGAEGRLLCVILAEDAGGNARGRLERVVGGDRVRLLRVSSRRRLGAALGREDLVTVGVTDEGFARLVAGLLPEETGAGAAAAGGSGPGQDGPGRRD